MSDATATTETTPAPATNAEPASGLERKPADPEKRAKLQRRAAARKLVGKVSDAEDAEAFWKKIEALAEKEGRKLEIRGAKVSDSSSQMAGAVDPARAAKWDGPARQVWGGLQQALGGFGQAYPVAAKFAAAMAVQKVTLVDADEKSREIEVDPIANLAGPTAKVMAKYLPEGALGPEAELAQAVAAVFVPVLAGIAFEALGRKLSEKNEGDEPKETGAIVKAAA